MSKKIVIFVGTIAIFILLLAGCLEQESTKPEELKEINVGLSWVHEAQYAGLYWADQNGLYEEQGLKVNFYEFEYEDLAQELVNEKYDFVFLQTESLLLAKEQGHNVKAIFTDYKLMPTVYYSKFENNITAPADLIGKTVGVAYTERYPLVAMLKEEEINVSLVNIVEREYDYGWLTNDSYDVEAGWITDGLLVEEAIGEYNVIRPYEYNINWYADLIVTTDEKISEESDTIQKFIQATINGWEQAIENPAEAALLTKEYGATYTDEHLQFVLQVSIPLINTGEGHLGLMEESVFEETVSILLDQEILTESIKVNDVFTNEFVENTSH
jgi:ABC-type nitrate/sulfonate/bicarbonate transport system substrate-binding protein